MRNATGIGLTGIKLPFPRLQLPGHECLHGKMPIVIGGYTGIK